MRLISKSATDLAYAICDQPANKRQTLDAEGALQGAFDAALETLAELFGALEAKRVAAAAGLQMRGNVGVVESLVEPISQVRHAFCQLHDLKWVVMENDADVASVVGEPYDDVEAFLKALGE